MSEKARKKKRGRKLGVKITHGAYSLIARGEFPSKRRYIERWLSEVRAGLIRDLGPTETDISTGQAILIDRTIGKLGILRCIEKHVRERGVRILSPLQIAAEIDAAKDRETAEEGPGSSRDGRSSEDEAGRTESD